MKIMPDVADLYMLEMSFGMKLSLEKNDIKVEEVLVSMWWMVSMNVRYRVFVSRSDSLHMLMMYE